MSKLYETLAADNIRMSVTIDGEDLMDFVKAAFVKLEEESRQRREQLDQDANMTREEVKDLLGVCDTTLWMWAKRKVLVPHKVGRRCFYKKSDVMAMFNGRK